MFLVGFPAVGRRVDDIEQRCVDGTPFECTRDLLDSIAPDRRRDPDRNHQARGEGEVDRRTTQLFDDFSKRSVAGIERD